MTLYRLHSLPVEVTREQAQLIGADIFFRPPSTYVVDVPKQHRSAIAKSPVVPTFIVECHASYQLYFAAKDWHPQIAPCYLAPYFGGQVVQAFARKPNYLDVTTLVQKRWQHAVSYNAKQIASSFPRSPKAETYAPTNSSASLFPSPLDEEHVLAGILQGQLDKFPELETDHFCSPSRHPFQAIRNLESRHIAIRPDLVHHELVAYDRLAGQDHQYSAYGSATHWPIARLKQLASVPIPIDLVIAAYARLDSRLQARRLVLELDAEAERQQAEIDANAMEDAA